MDGPHLSTHALADINNDGLHTLFPFSYIRPLRRDLKYINLIVIDYKNYYLVLIL